MPVYRFLFLLLFPLVRYVCVFVFVQEMEPVSSRRTVTVMWDIAHIISLNLCVLVFGHNHPQL